MVRNQYLTIFAKLHTWLIYCMEWIKNRNKLLIILGLLLVVWLNHNQVTNWHYHILNNGSVVMHAHPYKSSSIPDTPYQKHHHSSFEYLVLSVLFNTIPLLVAVWILGLLLCFRLKDLLVVYREGHMQYGFCRTLTLRGPPTCFG